jgi:hypothetical protein
VKLGCLGCVLGPLGLPWVFSRLLSCTWEDSVLLLGWEVGQGMWILLKLLVLPALSRTSLDVRDPESFLLIVQLRVALGHGLTQGCHIKEKSRRDIMRLGKGARVPSLWEGSQRLLSVLPLFPSARALSYAHT